MGKIISDRRARAAFCFAAFCAAALAVGLWRAGIGEEDLRRGWEAGLQFLRHRPIWLFAALVLLPGLPVPASALLLLAGVVWRDHPARACGLSILAMMMNLSWTYWLAAGVGRGTVERICGWLGIRIPDVSDSNRLRLVLALKLTPGIPMFVQNYLCGFLRVPFRTYLVVSLACNGLISAGLVLAGAGLGDGRLVPALAGFLLLILGILLVRWGRIWLAGRKA